MKKFLVVYMADRATFERMMKEINTRAAKAGHGCMDEMDGQAQGVAR